MFGILGKGICALLSLVLPAVGHAVVGQVIKLGFQVAGANGYLDVEGWTIDQYFEDLTKKAKDGKLRPAIGRESDINALFTVLSKQTKSNVCITGEAGVGKTALIEGFAYAVAHGDVPEEFKNVRVLKVNMVDLMVGRSYTSDNNCMARMRAVFDAVKKYDEKNGVKTILIMDEFHQVVKYKIAELCKQNFDRDDFKCVAATTINEYNQYIRPDAALERRFPELRLKEPNAFQTLDILKDRVPSLEKENNIKISEQAVIGSISLSQRYMINRHFPDKAIDILNSSVKRAKLTNKSEVTIDEVLQEIKEVTGIPVTRPTDSELIQLFSMEERLNSQVVGQEQAIKVVSDCVKNGRMDISSPNKPLGSFVFAGNTGVGKTMLAEKLGQEVGHIIRLDMAQYVTKGSLYDLLLKDGELPREIVKHPSSVILFDNMDKAGVDAKNIVAEILDKGILGVYGADRKLDFRNCYIFMATTADSDDQDRNAKLTQTLGSNLLYRTDEVIWFNNLDFDNSEKLVRGYVGGLSSKLSRLCGHSIKFNDSVYKYFTEKGMAVKEGARGLRKIIDKELTNSLMSFLINLSNQEIQKEDNIVCSIGEEGIKFEIKKPDIPQNNG